MSIKKNNNIMNPIVYDIVFVILLIIGLSYAVSVAISYPLTFDEGYNLQIPQNLSNRGWQTYETNGWHGRSSFDPWITTGPPILFSIAFFIKIFGTSLLWVKMTSLIYWVLFLVMLYIYLKRYNQIVALLSILLWLIYPMQRAIGIFGDFAAMFYLLIGLYLFETNTKPKKILDLLAGVCLGLAVSVYQYYFLKYIGLFAYVAFQHMLIKFMERWRQTIRI